MAKLHRFKNRMQAGELLAQRLSEYAGRPDVIVLALPRGGVPVGFAIAKALEVQLDVLLVRKIGAPGRELHAVGAVASGGLCVLQSDALKKLNIKRPVVEAAARRELKDIERREKMYRDDRPAPHLDGRIVILVGDGLSTPSIMQIAANVVRKHKPARVIVAVPVAAPGSCKALKSEVDEVICLSLPDPFYAVGMWYEHFNRTTDDHVRNLLEEAEQVRRNAHAHQSAQSRKQSNEDQSRHR